VRSHWAKRWLSLPLLIIYSLWAVLFYELIFTAWTLEYSFYGAFAVIAATLLFMYAYPKADRRFMIRFTLFALVVAFGIKGVTGYPRAWVVIDWILMSILALILGRILIKMKVWKLAVVLAVLTVFEIWIPLSDTSLLAAYNVPYIGHLASQDPQVPSLPITTLPSKSRPGLSNLVTLRAHAPVKDEAQHLVDMLTADPSQSANILLAIKQLQHSYDIVIIRPGRLRFHVSIASPEQLASIPASALGLVDFPFTTAHFLTVDNKVRMYFTLSEKPADLFSMMLSPGTVSDATALLGERTEATLRRRWNELTGRQGTFVDGLTLSGGYLTGTYDGQAVHVRTSGVAILGVHHLLPISDFASPQAVVEGNNELQIVTLPPSRPRVIGVLKGTLAEPLTTDIVFADVSGTGFDSLLVNTVPAQILQFQRDGTWKRLWVANRDSFRFEVAEHRKGGDLLIVNSPSLISSSKVRYLGAYVYRDHQLVRIYRAYHDNLVDLQVVHVTSRTEPQIAASVYSNQEIMLLSPSRIPWVTVVEVGYAVVILVGLWRRLTAKGRAA
jgi:hypothetical protein